MFSLDHTMYVWTLFAGFEDYHVHLQHAAHDSVNMAPSPLGHVLIRITHNVFFTVHSTQFIVDCTWYTVLCATQASTGLLWMLVSQERMTVRKRVQQIEAHAHAFHRKAKDREQ